MKNKYIPIVFLVLILGAVIYFMARGQGANFEINKKNPAIPVSSGGPTVSEAPRSPISGLACANANRRPLAVMLSGDAVARPLSGLAEADLVVEMSVVTGDINRYMAVFVCGDPKEIGSIRSSRTDYIPLAKGLDAIYAHWGGSHFALDKLNAGVIDNIDALKNPYDAFYRKSGIAAPHNGFSSAGRLFNSAQKLGYRLTNNFGGYLHLSGDEIKPAATTTKTLLISYPGSFQAKYVYDPSDNSYWRSRGGTKETDKNISKQVAAKNVVIMRAPSHQIEGQYNAVAVEGAGRATVYRNGEEIQGSWKKDAGREASKLYFYDSSGQEIKFVPGSIWVEVVEPSTDVLWQ